MKVIDSDTWNRKTSYNTFIDQFNPTFSITTRLDVTQLYNRCKREGTSFFTDLLYIVMKCLNNVDEMRLRLKGDDIVLYDTIDPGFIVMKDDESITSCRVGMCDYYPEFYNKVRNAIEDTKTQTSVEKMNKDQSNDVFYISCLPWMDFTSVNHPYDYFDRESCSIPRITWGKAVEKDGVRTLAFDISAHHALVDGYQISKGVGYIQDALNDPTFFENLI